MKDKSRKREQAIERQLAYDKLTVDQKIAKLDQMYGKGNGATKQRAKLAKQKGA